MIVYKRVLNLQSVGGAGLVVSKAEPTVFDDEVGASRQGDGPWWVHIVHFDPKDRKVSDILHRALQLDRTTNVYHLFLRDVRDGWETLAGNCLQRQTKVMSKNMYVRCDAEK